MTDLYKSLAAPFPPIEISWRVGSTNAEKSKGLALAYLDARSVMHRLDDAIGPQHWQCRYPFAGCCEIGLFVDPLGWIWKANGAGVTEVEAEKGQFSDAFKRAAVLWGIGRYLYDLPPPWVPIVPAGKSYRIADEALTDLTQRLAAWQAKRFGESK
ncbi:MAG: DNA repair protein Rad52 [Patescibacteria group bacterium]|nr:DNA repair protein Rad52 [Patescibacteria group bacterium]